MIEPKHGKHSAVLFFSPHCYRTLNVHWTLEQKVWNCMGPLTCIFFSINIINVFSLLYDFLILFSLAHFTVIICYIVHITYRIHVNQLCMILVRLSVKVVKFYCGESKDIHGYSPSWGISVPNPRVVQDSSVISPCNPLFLVCGLFF